MNKVIVIMVAIVIILFGIIGAGIIYRNQQFENNNYQDISQVAQDEEIYDDCTDEGAYIAEVAPTGLDTDSAISVNNPYGETDKTEFVLREENNLIVIYKVENGEEIEYDATDISTSYLPEEDKQNLKNGITVYGEKNLNQILEDYE